MRISRIYAMALLILVACAPKIVVDADFDRETDFNTYHTFHITEAEHVYDPAFPMFDNELNRKRIEGAIYRQMLDRGFKYHQGEQADVLVDFHVVIKDKTAIDSYHPDGTPIWRRFNVEVYDYTEGTLVVHLVDSSDKRLIWQGSATSVLRMNSKNPEERIHQAVALIFTNYPPLP